MTGAKGSDLWSESGEAALSHLSPQLAELQDKLRTHLQRICCERDPLFSPLGHLAVRSYIDEQLSQWGEVCAEEFEYNGQLYCNLILDLPGQPTGSRGGSRKATVGTHRSMAESVLLGAHYDAVRGSPGADDNGSGMAALLVMAEQFATQPARLPLRIVAFDAEEYGCLGSRAHVQRMVEDECSLRLMLSLEMLGYCTTKPQRYPADWMKYFYPKQGDFLALVGNLGAMGDLWKLKRSLQSAGVPTSILPVPQRGEWLPRLRASDHAAFWDWGCNAAMVTDTADLRNPNYHQGSDRIETLDLDFLGRSTEGLIQGIQAL